MIPPDIWWVILEKKSIQEIDQTDIDYPFLFLIWLIDNQHHLDHLPNSPHHLSKSAKTRCRRQYNRPIAGLQAPKVCLDWEMFKVGERAGELVQRKAFSGGSA